jgi:osmotically-inducible protein OsmY
MLTRKRIIAVIFSSIVLSAAGCADQREKTGQYLDDSVISAKVNSALLADPQVSGTAIEVETYRGTV